MSFASPFAFLLLGVPLFVLWFRPPADRGAQAIYLPPSLAGRMARQDGGRFRPAGLGPIAIWCLLVLAIAGPRIPATLDIITASGRDIVLAIDLSGSMEKEDFQLNGRQVSRLEAVKDVAARFVEGRVGDRVGVVVFGDRAYTAAPLTHDVLSVARTVSELTIGVSGRSTAISDGLGLALKRLQGGAAESQVVILLSDGIDTTGTVAPPDAASLANALGIRIHTIALGPQDLATAPNAKQAVDAGTLDTVARSSGGQMFRVRSTDDLERVAASVDLLEPSPSRLPPVRAYDALWVWPAGAALGVTLAILVAPLLRWPRPLANAKRRPA